MGNDIVSTVNGILGPSDNCIARTYPRTKEQIERQVTDFIDEQLDHFESGQLYVHFKQLEFAIKTGLEYMREIAFDSIGYLLGGFTSGIIFGHHVAIAYPQKWVYSEAVEELKERFKNELTVLLEIEKANGTAIQIPGPGRITVTLKGK